MILYHGTKSKHNNFDPLFFKSGEGVGSFEGWYFTDNLEGAKKHVVSYLRDINGPGFVYECEVPDHYTIENCEQGYTDLCYGCQSTGVELKNSHHIKIIKVINLAQNC